MVNKRLTTLACSLTLILVLIAVVLLGSCSTPAPVTTTATQTATTTATVATTTTTTSTATTVINPIVLKYAPSTLAASPVLGQTLVLVDQIKLLESRTNGQIKIDVYWSQTLAKATDLATGVNSGLIDMTHLRPYGEPGKLPLSSVGEMPGISTDLSALQYAYFDLVRQEPIASELAKFKCKPVYGLMTQETNIISRVPIRSLADLKGKKIAAGGIAGEELKQLGAVTVAMSPVEQGEGLLKGTIDGIVAPIDAMYSFKFYEGGKYLTVMNLGPRIQPIVINQDAWNKLPANVQQVFNDSAHDLLDIAYVDIIKNSNDVIWKEFANSKVEIINLSAADVSAIQQIQSAYGDKWAADQEAAGLAGKKVLADYRSLVAKYEKTSPYKK
jgi:TRAP-type transport system periplasmic protein